MGVNVITMGLDKIGSESSEWLCRQHLWRLYYLFGRAKSIIVKMT